MLSGVQMTQFLIQLNFLTTIKKSLTFFKKALGAYEFKERSLQAGKTLNGGPFGPMSRTLDMPVLLH